MMVAPLPTNSTPPPSGDFASSFLTGSASGDAPASPAFAELLDQEKKEDRAPILPEFVQGLLSGVAHPRHPVMLANALGAPSHPTEEGVGEEVLPDQAEALPPVWGSSGNLLPGGLPFLEAQPAASSGLEKLVSASQPQNQVHPAVSTGSEKLATASQPLTEDMASEQSALNQFVASSTASRASNEEEKNLLPSENKGEGQSGTKNISGETLRPLHQRAASISHTSPGEHQVKEGDENQLAAKNSAPALVSKSATAANTPDSAENPSANKPTASTDQAASQNKTHAAEASHLNDAVVSRLQRRELSAGAAIPRWEESHVELTRPAQSHSNEAPLTSPSFSSLIPTRPQAPVQGNPAVNLTSFLQRIQEAAEAVRTGNPNRVDLELPLNDQQSVRVRLEMRSGEILTTIRSDSRELRELLERAWPEFSSRHAERGLRLGEAVFQNGDPTSQQRSFGENPSGSRQSGQEASDFGRQLGDQAGFGRSASGKPGTGPSSPGRLSSPPPSPATPSAPSHPEQKVTLWA